MILQLEQQVTSLKSSIRMKELGFRQESLFYWHMHPQTDKWAVALGKPYPDAYTNWHPCYASAYTVAELGVLLPITILSNKENGKLNEYYVTYQKFENGNHLMALDGCSYECGCLHSEGAETEAEARSLMLIHLAENGLIEVGKC